MTFAKGEDKDREEIRNRIESLDKEFKKIIKEERKLGKEGMDELKRDLRDIKNKFEELEEKVEAIESRMIEFMEGQETNSTREKDRESDLEERRSIRIVER